MENEQRMWGREEAYARDLHRGWGPLWDTHGASGVRNPLMPLQPGVGVWGLGQPRMAINSTLDLSCLTFDELSWLFFVSLFGWIFSPSQRPTPTTKILLPGGTMIFQAVSNARWEDSTTLPINPPLPFNATTPPGALYSGANSIMLWKVSSLFLLQETLKLFWKFSRKFYWVFLVVFFKFWNRNFKLWVFLCSN